MSKFLNSLFKGFIRSAVNQVGRDGGRVVSNKVYIDKHSIPIRNVTGNKEQLSHLNPSIQAKQKSTFDNLKDTDLRKELFENGFKPELTSMGLISVFFIIIASFTFLLIKPLHYLVVAYWGFIGFKNLTRRSTPFVGYQKAPVYKEDKRYNSGKRLIGYDEKKVYADVEVMPSAKEKLVYVLKGLLSIIFAVLIFYIGFGSKLEKNSLENDQSSQSELIIDTNE